ncbi:MAG: dTDP-4-dehydrorhamnose 3,5-epimerase family protein [Gemmatimonadetes bacterium]|nr:dTDP-4-dehydrorhamnose 3,5-epimerase family protein [Gemmatimonadota bacterium]
MDIRDELLPGCYAVETYRYADDRGLFSKAFSRDGNRLFERFSCAEFFYSTSGLHVVRGMHLQLGNAMMEKFIFCMGGSVLDVLVDLREGAGFGRVASLSLAAESGVGIFIPRGIAHGFLSQSEHSMIGYLTSQVHVPALDAGVHWRSIAFDWPVQAPVVSSRDEALPPISTFRPIPPADTRTA